VVVRGRGEGRRERGVRYTLLLRFAYMYVRLGDWYITVKSFRESDMFK
jgi:hypothetical protein